MHDRDDEPKKSPLHSQLEAEQLNADILASALETIDEAVGIYDPQDRLIGFNRHYAEVRSAIGGSVALGVAWEDLVAASVAAGRIPEAVGREAEWLAYRRRVRGEYSVLRQLPDGRFYQVNERRMRNGGIAVLWTEVTRLKQAQETMLHAQKLNTIGQLAGGIAHQFNNLLTVVIGQIDRLAPRLTHREQQIALAAVRGAERAAELSHHLLSYAQRQMLQPDLIDLNRVMARLAGFLEPILGEHIVVRPELAARPCVACVDTRELETALLNLAVNARDAMPDGGTLTIRTARTHLDAQAAAGYQLAAGRFVTITVTDTGSGISAEHLPQVFDPFFTTKPLGEGVGLGLAQVYGFARQSGGHVTLKSRHGVGTSIRIYLPVAEPSGEDANAVAVNG